MIGDRWPFRVALLDDELLSSYLIRNANAHGSTPYSFASYYWPGRQVWNRDIDRIVDPSWLDEFAFLAGITSEQLEASSLFPFRRILGRTLRNGDTPLILSVSVYHRTRRRHGLQFCAACFADGRHGFRRVWRLGFVLSCPEHGIPLLDACPTCDSPVVPHRSLYLDPYRCYQCGAFLGRCVSMQPLKGSVIEWQKRLVQILLGEVDSVGPFDRLEAFISVRSLISVLTDRKVHEAIRAVFYLPVVPLPVERLQFEHARSTVRVLLIETLATWLADWPVSFRIGAAAARLTQRTFHRLKQPKTLQAEVSHLPPGHERERSYVPKVFDRELLSLSRRNMQAYRTLRACRLKVLAGLG